MSSLPEALNTALSRFQPDRATERKSGAYAAALTAGIVLALNAAFFTHAPQGAKVPLGDTPLTVELRRVGPMPERSQPPVAAKDAPRKLLRETPAQDDFVVAQTPDKSLASQPEITPKPVPAPQKPQRARPALKVAPKVAPKTTQKTPPTQAAARQSNSGEETASPHAAPGESARPAGHASGTAQPGTQSNADTLAALLRAVEKNKKYPRHARRAGIEGKVVLRVCITAEGAVISCFLEQPCGKKILDGAARKLGESLVGLRIPQAQGKSMNVRIPVRYALH